MNDNSLRSDLAYLGSTTNISSEECVFPSSEKLMSLIDDIPVIYIWKGNESDLIRFNLCKGDKPVLMLCEYIEDEKAYIMSGYGILAGKIAYQYLTSILIRLKWSDVNIPLEKQNLGSLNIHIEEASNLKDSSL